MKTTLAACLCSVALLSPANAETIRWARLNDALSLDPHATSQAVTANFLHHVYETLVDADAEGNIVPRLATEWAIKEGDPKVWVFKLRPGVTFHDGAAFTAEDVVFSLDRARSGKSVLKALQASVADVRAVDDLTVEVETSEPAPTYPNNLTNIFMMDKGWAEANGVVEVQDFAGGQESFAARNENGTGMYVLTARDPEVRSTLALNEAHWSDRTPDVTGIEYLVISDPATRSAALLSGEVDLILDVPVQDIERLSTSQGIHVSTGAENRIIYFGYRLGSPLVNGNGEMSPFSDAKVREAVELAIDRDAIRQVIMREQSVPTDVILPPFVTGYDATLAEYPKPDLDRAKELLSEAGFADGFTVTLDTPNNRYVNDEMISQAVAGMLGRIGIKVNLVSRPISQHTQLVTGGKSDFYLSGWGVPTYDTAYTFDGLFRSRGGAFGQYNSMGYSNPELDAIFAQVNIELDPARRAEHIAAAWRTIQTDRPVLALHGQILAYAMRDGLNVEVNPSDMPRLYDATID